MSSNDSGLMSLLAQKMSYLNQKQAVHAENVANASTPGYKTREISAFTFTDALKQASVGMKVTDPRHIVPASMSGTNASVFKVRTSETTPNGNSVDPEEEAMKVSQTAAEYQLTTAMYHKLTGLFKLAIKGSTN